MSHHTRLLCNTFCNPNGKHTPIFSHITHSSKAVHDDAMAGLCFALPWHCAHSHILSGWYVCECVCCSRIHCRATPSLWIIYTISLRDGLGHRRHHIVAAQQQSNWLRPSVSFAFVPPFVAFVVVQVWLVCCRRGRGVKLEYFICIYIYININSKSTTIHRF